MASNNSPRTRVAVLGGGISALTAAWHLTSTPALRDRYDVTVYQMGWRLGGKLASGRNAKLGMRNQEHGLHVWFGWYENAFALFQQLLAEWLPMAPADCPIQQWQDAFEPCLYTPLGQQLGGERKLWKFKWSGNSDRPGDGKVLLSAKAILIGALQWMETLVARGVKLNFFHKVTNIRASKDGSHIEGLDIARQVRIQGAASGGQYQPLFTCKGMRCWPAEPLWQQLEGGEALQQAGVDLESNWCQLPPAEMIHLQAGSDFDHGVLGIALGPWKDLGYPGDLGANLRASNAKLRQMAAALPIMPSGGVQLWCDRTTTGLGFEQPGVPKARVAGVSIAPPMDVWADMTPTLATEDWGLDGPASVQYLCGTLDSDLYRQPPTNAAVPKQARDRLLELMAGQLKATGAVMWPAARKGDDFDWDVLHADPAAQGIERLDQQWIRANVDPTECCVSSPANTTQLRLRADQTGVDNLWLCGECAYTGVNSTCVESVVMAGMQAARALSGQSLTVVGETFLAGGWRPAK